MFANTISIILGGVVIFFAVIYFRKTSAIIIRYKYALNNGGISEVPGEVCAKIDETVNSVYGEKIETCYPRYSYSINNAIRYYDSPIKRRNITLGQPVTLAVDNRTGEVWMPGDFTTMEKLMIRRLLVAGAVVIVLMLTTIFL
jgi:hypothetical protein